MVSQNRLLASADGGFQKDRDDMVLKKAWGRYHIIHHRLHYVLFLYVYNISTILCKL